MSDSDQMSRYDSTWRGQILFIVRYVARAVPPTWEEVDNKQGQYRSNHKDDLHPSPHRHANTGHKSYAGRRGQPSDIRTDTHDGSGAQKSDSGHTTWVATRDGSPNP